MRSAKDRAANFKGFAECDTYDRRIRHIVEQTLCAPENPASINYIIKYFKKFLAKT
jgi:hypothetical protein